MRDANLVLAISNKPTLDEFFSKLGISRRKLAAQLLEQVYKAFFVSSTDLKEEYVQYYSVEYATLQEYLELGHEIHLSEEELEKKFILKIDQLVGVVDPMFEDNLLNEVVECIKSMESEHEN